ncbi:putative transcription factor interactor and regulator CCHC(Zn) family [Helianthus annuus]|nr:putative transcription factor interactor and regulator CCHC(Zn) family [Helianthus annuus]
MLISIQWKHTRFDTFIWYQPGFAKPNFLFSSPQMADNIISATTLTADTTTTPTVTMVNFPSSLKLTSTNYLSWKTQLDAILQGLDLYKFVDGSHLAPKPTVNTDGSTKPHADYNAWYRQDRLLFGAIVGSLSAEIVPLITNAKTSLDACKILASTYASPSRGHIKQLQHRLKKSVKTPDQSITNFMQTIKILVDELAILGKPMDPEDVTDTILQGLDSKAYKPVIESVHARDNPISFHELHEKLINHELSLSQNPPESTSIHQPASAFAAHTRPYSKQWPSRPPSNALGLLPTPSSASAQRPFLGKCQWCFTKGHSLTSCPSFKKSHPQITLPTYNRTQTQPKPQAHLMTTHPTVDSDLSWLKDSGASHHITNDLNALSMHNPYDGTEELIIGDGLSHSPNNSSGNH